MATALPAYQSQLQELITMLGSQVATNSNSTATRTGDTDALRQVFQSSMDAAGQTTPELQALIDSIFTEGAQKIPELTGALANATGTRTTGNSSLALALGELNKSLSSTAVTALLQSQAQARTTAASAASKIADANSTETKNSNQTAVTTPKVNPLVPLLAGFALNKADKGGMFDLLKNKTAPDGSDVASSTTTTPSSMITGGDTFTAPANLGGLNSTYAGDNPFLGVATGNAMDQASDFGDLLTPGTGAVDFGTDEGLSGALDVASDFGPAAVDLGSVSSDALDLASDFGFKNGGALSKGATTKPVKGYADGGPVRNVNYTGSEAAPSPLVSAINSNTTPAPVRRDNDNTDSTNAAVSGDTGGIGVTDASNTNGIVGTPEQNSALVQGMISTVVGMLTGVPGLSTAINAATGGKSLISAALSGAGQASGITGAPVGSVTPGAIGAPTSNDAPSTGNGDSVDGGVSDGGIGGVGGGTGPASSSVGGGDDGTASYSNGGRISGPGTGTSDSIPANVSNGEYILPADVVRYFGTRQLDKLKDMIHQPA